MQEWVGGWVVLVVEGGPHITFTAERHATFPPRIHTHIQHNTMRPRAAGIAPRYTPHITTTTNSTTLPLAIHTHTMTTQSQRGQRSLGVLLRDVHQPRQLQL